MTTKEIADVLIDRALMTLHRVAKILVLSNIRPEQCAVIEDIDNGRIGLAVDGTLVYSVYMDVNPHERLLIVDGRWVGQWDHLNGKMFV